MLLCARERVEDLVGGVREKRMLEVLELELLEKVFERVQRGYFDKQELERLVKTVAVFTYYSARRYVIEGGDHEREYGGNVGMLLDAVVDKHPMTL
jgi:hypothetical protein